MPEPLEELQEDIAFLEAEITGLRARIAERDGAVKRSKLRQLVRILGRHQKSLAALIARRSAAA